jgi:hypothetical protein
MSTVSSIRGGDEFYFLGESDRRWLWMSGAVSRYKEWKNIFYFQKTIAGCRLFLFLRFGETVVETSKVGKKEEKNIY